MRPTVPADPFASRSSVESLWERAWGKVFPMEPGLYDQRIVAGRIPGTVLLSGDGGFALLRAPRPREMPSQAGSTGHISFLLLDPEAPDGETVALLDATIAALRRAGAARIKFGGDYGHFFPGLPLSPDAHSERLGRLLRARGFRLGQVVEDLSIDLGTDPAAGSGSPDRIETCLPSGYGFKCFEPGLRGVLDRFLARSFPGRWSMEIREALACGMRHQDLALAVCEGTDAGEVAAFARIADAGTRLLIPSVFWRRALGPGAGGLGPIGVDPAERGRGLGMGMLRACMLELRGRGVRTMGVDWTDQGAFYGKAGFRSWRRYAEATLDAEKPL